MPAIQTPQSDGNSGASPAAALSSPFLDSTACIRQGSRTVVLYPWHQRPDVRPDLERIDEGYAADSVESWFPIDDHHWYFTRIDLGRLFQETTAIRGDLYLRKTTELRRWLARALDEGEVRAYWWAEPQMSLPSSSERQVALAMAGPGENAWYGMSDEPANKPEPWPTNEPQSLNECLQRLQAAKERIRLHKFQPKYSDADLLAIRDAGGAANHRFVVWVASGTKQDGEGVGFTRVSKRSTAWTAPFTMTEDADLDPALLCAKNAMIYKPDQSYTVIIVDRSVSVPGAIEPVTIVPTFANISRLGQSEFAKDGISKIYSKNCMTPEFNAKYKVIFEKFLLHLKGKWALAFNPKVARQFSKRLGPVDGPLFIARHRYQSQFGANQHFTGNGFTGQLKIEGEPGTHKKYGSLEVMTLEINPPRIAQRKAAGGAHVIHIPAKKT